MGILSNPWLGRRCPYYADIFIHIIHYIHILSIFSNNDNSDVSRVEFGAHDKGIGVYN
jgi:hypothetical protein